MSASWRASALQGVAVVLLSLLAGEAALRAALGSASVRHTLASGGPSARRLAQLETGDFHFNRCGGAEHGVAFGTNQAGRRTR